MNKKVIGGRPPFVEVDNVIVQAVKDLAGRWNVPAIDRELITLFIVGDLCHKVATLTPGILWHDGPAKFKNWRLFFPRSHPYQLLLQSAVNLPPTGEMIKAIKVALNEQRQAFVNGVLELCVTKIMAKCFYPEWSQENYQEKQPDGTILVKDPHDFVLKAVVFGEPPPGEYPHLKLKTALSDFLNKNYPDFLAIEFGNVVDALVDSTGKPRFNVGRSEAFPHRMRSQSGRAKTQSLPTAQLSTESAEDPTFGMASRVCPLSRREANRWSGGSRGRHSGDLRYRWHA